MRISEAHFPNGVPIDSYGPGFFRVAGEVLTGPLALVPEGPVDWPGLPEVGCFLERCDRIDVLFVGMGAEIAILDKGVRQRLESAGIGVEVMTTPSACRTYNVLLTEGRRIAAALMPIRRSDPFP